MKYDFTQQSLSIFFKNNLCIFVYVHLVTCEIRVEIELIEKKMFRLFFLTMVTSLSVNGQQDDLYEFTQDKNALSKCIEDRLLNFAHYDQEIAKFVADLTAKKFSGETVEKIYFFRRVNNFFRILRSRISNLFQFNQLQESLHWSVRYALIDCAESNQIPIFGYEPLELANILDYILVYWPTPLASMISSRSGRLVLRRYIEDAQLAFNTALDYLGNHNHFRVVMRIMWLQRAQDYFDGRLTQFPYLRYRYTMSRGIRMYDDILGIYSARSRQNFSNRNPMVPYVVADRFLDLHVADRPPYAEHDAFAEYELDGTMRSAEYYIETRIDQFYRVLIFFMELQSHGVQTREDDVFEGPIPCHVLHEDLQKVVVNNHAYSSYLSSLRKCLERSRAYGKDLMPLFSPLISLRSVNNSTIKVTMTSSTTTKYDHIRRKSSLGANFLKRPRMTSGGEKQQQFENNYKYYGYVSRDTCISEELQSSEEDLLVFMKIVHDLFTEPLCKPQNFHSMIYSKLSERLTTRS